MSRDPASFSEDNGSYVNCRLISDLLSRLELLEVCISTMEAKPASQVITQSASNVSQANLASIPPPLSNRGIPRMRLYR